MKRIVLAAALLLLAGAAVAQQPSNQRFWRTSQVSVATSATLVAVNTPTRSAVTITTVGTNQVYCGNSNAVTAGNGQPINPTANSSITIPTSAAVWCIAASAQTVAVMESYQ